jgi:phage terminase large subunit GpA-like protein
MKAKTIYQDALNDGLRPAPYISLWEWADRFLYLPRESSKEYGKYSSSRTPFVREPLDELSPMSPTNEVVLIKPTQCAGTTIGIIFLLASADLYPAPSLFVTVTGELARSFSKKKIAPTVRDTQLYGKRLVGKIKDMKIRDSGNTILEKVFPGGSWRFAGSNSAAIYRSESIKYVLLDDYDGFIPDVEGEGDPGSLADKRTDTFADAKIYKNSTPTIRDLSAIERDFELTSQGHWHCCCPHCSHYQFLDWPRLKFDRENLSWIHYLCEGCQKPIEEQSKPYLNENGRYVHKYPDREKRGFKYNGLVTPLGWKSSWQKIIQEFLDGKKNKEKLKVWTNTRLANSFEEEGSQPDWVELKKRAIGYKMFQVPQGGGLITVGVDVQQDRLALSVWAYGEGEESWLVFWGELWGDPAQPEVWETLERDFLLRAYARIDGPEMRITSVAVDSGFHTHQVYNFCRLRAPNVFPVKGAVRRNQQIIGKPTLQDVHWSGQVIKNGVQLWPIGTDTAKATLYSRLQIKDGPGAVHFPVDVDEEFYQQLTAEKQVTKFVKGYPTLEWIKVRERNEGLDCTVYALAAAYRAGLATMNFQRKKPAKRPKPQPQGVILKQKRHIKPVRHRRPDWLDR